MKNLALCFLAIFEIWLFFWLGFKILNTPLMPWYALPYIITSILIFALTILYILIDFIDTED